MNRFLSLCGVICGLIGLWGFCVLSIGYSRGPTDFVQDYAAGHALLHGHSIYGDEIESYTRALLGFQGHHNFHPPTNAVFFSPLALLPYNVAFLVWNGISLILYLWIIGASYRVVRPPLPALFVFGFGLVWWPFLHGVELGQSSILIAALILGGWFALRREQSYLGGALLGLAATIKLFPLFLGAYLVMTKDRRALLAMIGVFCTVTTVTTMTVGIEDTLRYVYEIIPRDIVDWSGSVLNTSLFGLFLPLSTTNPYVQPLVVLRFEDVVWWIKLLSIVVALFAIVRARLFILAGEGDRAFALIVVTMLIISPLTWVHIFPILIPILMALWRIVAATRIRFVVILALILLSISNILLLTSLIRIWRPLLLPGGVYVLAALSTHALLILFTLLVYRRSHIPVVIPVTPRHNTSVL